MVALGARSAMPARRSAPLALVGGMLLPLVAFLVFAILARSGQAFAWETNLLTTIHAGATPGLDRFALWCSRVFYSQVLIVVAVLLAVGFALRRRWGWTLTALGTVVGALLLNTAVKAIVDRPRPALWPSLTGETSSGFPSGHAMTSFAFGALLILLARHARWRGLVVVAVALVVALVGWSRLYLGAHYPTDVLAGWCLSLAWVTAVWLLAARVPGR